VAHPDNAFYGHNRALARYVGRADVPIIDGHLQHGWSPYTGLAEPHRLVGRLTKFLWSSQNLAQARAAGIERLNPIGAPFVYLEAVDDGSREPAPPGSMIVYPYHSIERTAFFANHRRYIDEIRDRATGPVTVCLYWRDHDLVEVRSLYQDAGFRVICHGRREDALFLERQLVELRGHEVVATNRVGSALWYGAYLGLDAVVFGPVFGQWEAEEGARYDAFQRSRYPELFDPSATPEDRTTRAGVELGAEHRRPASELSRMLGWDPGRSAPRPALRLRTITEHRTRTAVHHLRRLVRHAA